MQTDFQVIHHSEPNHGPVEEALNELAKTHTIMNVACASREFVKNGGNHGRGGAYHTSYVIVAFREDHP